MYLYLHRHIQIYTHICTRAHRAEYAVSPPKNLHRKNKAAETAASKQLVCMRTFVCMHACMHSCMHAPRTTRTCTCTYQHKRMAGINRHACVHSSSAYTDYT